MKLENRQSPWRKRLDRALGIPLVVAVALIRKLLSPFFKQNNQQVSRILVVKLSALGDVILMFPSLYRLRETFKSAQIDFLAGQGNSEFLKFSGVADSVEVFSLRTCFKIVSRRYDLVIDYDQWVRATAVLTGLIRGGRVAGFKSPGQGRHYAYDLTCSFDRKLHMAENFWNLTRLSLPAKSPVSFKGDAEAARKKWSEMILKKSGASAEGNSWENSRNHIVIHPGCGDHGIKREWPIENWIELISLIKGKYPDSQILVTGKGPRERWLASQLIPAGVVSWVDQGSLSDLIMLLSRARLVFAPNTGIMHLADLLNDFVNVLEGPTDMALWGPLWRGKNRVSPLACSPCLTWGYDYGCSDPVCMRAVTAESVFEAL